MSGDTPAGRAVQRYATALAHLDAIDGGRERPVIYVAAGGLVQAVRGGIDALHTADTPIYERGGILVRPVRIEQPQTGAIRRDAGAVTLVAVDPDWIRLRLADVADWRRRTQAAAAGPDAEWRDRRVDPPVDVARTIARVPDEGGWQQLVAVVRHPVLLPSGEWLGASGYRDGLLLDLDKPWPEPGTTREAAATALDEVRVHLRYYPWAADEDEAVAISMLLTAVMRCVIEAAPMHCTDAPTAGSGKSLLIDVAAILATGARATVMDYGRDPAEAAKRLDGLLLAGDPVIALDNVEAALEGAGLCQTLTQPARRIRPLGASTMVTVPCSALLTATGNNITIRGDLVRRAIVCRLDAGMERPELRKIDQDLLAETRARRGELGSACQTIVRAYITAGCPDVGIAPLGSYGEWSRYVRAPLVWLGLPDPAAVMERTRADDPSREAIAAVLAAWHAAFGAEAATAQDAIGRAAQDGDLHDALAMVATKRGNLDARPLGYWLRAHRDARSGALTLRREGPRGPYRWRVESAHGADSAHKPALRGRTHARTYSPSRAETSAPCAPSTPAARVDDLIDAARAGTTFSREQARELLAQDLDNLVAGTLPVAAAHHFLEHRDDDTRL